MAALDQFELPAANPSAAYSATARLATGEAVTWPATAGITTVEDPRIFSVRFLDGAVVHPEAIAAIRNQAALQPIGLQGFGGKKVREESVWQTPALQLISRRALLFFCKCYNVSAAHAVDQWANVMETGDYSYPHCHYDSQVSLVYYLDPGEADPREKMAGRFHFSDPRIPYCCSTHPERPTRGLLPDIRGGTMIMFPSELVHFVHPYRGRTPRITLAWNISPGLRPATTSAASAVPRGMFQG